MVSDYKKIFKNKAFLYLWISQILSQVTINAMNFLLLTSLFDKTGSTIAVSFLWIAYALPFVIIGPIAAVAVDLVNRKRVLVATNFLQATIVFLYALSHEYSLFLLYGVVVLYSLLNQFYVPSEQSALPSVVDKDELAVANGLFFTTQQLALIIGFGLASPLLGFLGFENSLLLNSFLLFLAFLSVCFMPDMKVEEKISGRLEEAIESFFKKFVSGYEFIKENRYVLAPFVLLLGLQVTLTIVMVNIPIISGEIFDIPKELAGILLVLPGGLGAILGTFTVPRLLRKNMRKIRVIEKGFTLLVLTLFFVIFFIPPFGQPLKLILGWISLFLMGLSFTGIIVPTQTFFQEKTPLGFRGRVFGNYWFLVAVISLLPVLFSGTITEIFGIKILLSLLEVALFLTLLFIKKRGETFLAGQ